MIQASAWTDAGIRKKINQDAALLEIAVVSGKNMAFCVVCDGIGGLSCGEAASADLIRAFSDWFETRFPVLWKQNRGSTVWKEEWNRLLHDADQRICAYGEANRIRLGTTVSAVLFLEDRYCGIHVGDGRLYEIGRSCRLLTTDHTFVKREMDAGRMTPAQAKVHPNRNMLLQCIGSGRGFSPQYLEGRIRSDCTFFLCSDGFRHEIGEEEMRRRFAPSMLSSEKEIKKALAEMAELCKKRKEQDNITGILIRIRPEI